MTPAPPPTPALTTARLTGLGLAGVGAGALSMAYVAEYVFGLEPCVLCLYQRIPYAVLVLLGFAALRWPGVTGQILQLAAGVFAAGAVIAVYHVGVEQHWWASAAGCTGTLNALPDTQNFLQSLESTPPKPCDAVDWTLLGVSMAGWNALFSSFGAGVCLYVWRRLKET